MEQVLNTASQAQAILQAWAPFKQAIGVIAVRSEADYAQAQATLAVLLDAVGDDENHPLAEVLDYLADQVKAFEHTRFPIPEAAPKDVLHFLMAQQGLKQEDLADCAPQSRISDILNGKRAISRTVAKRLAQRFHVRPDLFL